MRAADIAAVTTVASPRVHPDGRWIAFTGTVADLSEDRYLSEVWLWDGEVRRLTFGGNDSSPWWSPDGGALAFLRTTDGVAQVAVMPISGGEAHLVTDFDLGARLVLWSPDGASLLVLATEWFGEWADLDEDERARRPRRIDGFDARLDGRGWRHDRRDHLYLVDPSVQTPPRRVGSGEASEFGPAWSPDGTRVAFLTKLDDPRRLRSGYDLVETHLATGVRTTRATGSGFTKAVYDPGGVLHAVGHPTTEYPIIESLWRLDDPPSDITGHHDRSVHAFFLPPEMADPLWTSDGFLIPMIDSGRVGLVEFDPSGGLTPVLDGDRSITGADRAASGRLVFTATEPTCPGELYEWTPDGVERRLTSFNQDLDLVAPRHFRIRSEPGIEVDTWVYTPPGDGPHPVLVNIHGGPAAQYGWSFLDEFQVYVSAGYAVVASNPRGSAGRGKEWLQAVVGDGWGRVDLLDVTAALEAALDSGASLDGDRVGIMGGSYGGFLTAWATAHDDRYRSAVVERALTNWVSLAGTSDLNRDFPGFYLGVFPPAGHQLLWEAGPLAYADRIKTPTLVVHSENDLRCPIEQGEQLFTALLRNGVDTEMVRFPGEGHDLSRRGKPRHRVERFEHILRWHDRHLKSRSGDAARKCGDT